MQKKWTGGPFVVAFLLFSVVFGQKSCAPTRGTQAALDIAQSDNANVSSEKQYFCALSQKVVHQMEAKWSVQIGSFTNVLPQDATKDSLALVGPASVENCPTAI